MLDELLIRFARWILRTRTCTASFMGEPRGYINTGLSYRQARRWAREMVAKHGGHAEVFCGEQLRRGDETPAFRVAA